MVCIISSIYDREVIIKQWYHLLWMHTGPPPVLVGRRWLLRLFVYVRIVLEWARIWQWSFQLVTDKALFFIMIAESWMGKESRIRGCRYCWLGVQNHGLVAHNTNKGSTKLLRNRVLWQKSMITLLLLQVIFCFTATVIGIVVMLRCLQ
jgi:hypothetical protein